MNLQDLNLLHWFREVHKGPWPHLSLTEGLT